MDGLRRSAAVAFLLVSAGLGCAPKSAGATPAGPGARTRLADQRDIEKAKGLLMKRRGLDESAAYGLLRRMAMDRKQRIGDFARVLITAADVL